MTYWAPWPLDATHSLSSVPATLTVVSLTISVPRTAVSSMGSVAPLSHALAVRTAASMTPPVAPKITAAPVSSPRGSSNCSSGSMSNLMPDFLMR